MGTIIRSSQSLGSSIRAARRAEQITQSDLGRKTGLRQATISSIENGEGGTLESIFRILAELKLELSMQARSTSLADLDDIF